MEQKRGRRELYKTHVKPRMEEIRDWLSKGATERQVSDNLGIGYSTWNQYKQKYSELTEEIKNARQDIVIELRGALIRRALGYCYNEEKHTYVKFELPEPMKTALVEAGFGKEELEKINLEKIEITQKRMAEDVAAINLALKNYDKENWANDPQMLELRKREIELREKAWEQDMW